MKDEQVMYRKDAPAESIWAGAKVFPSWKDWEAEYQNVKTEFPAFADFSGKAGSSARCMTLNNYIVKE